MIGYILPPVLLLGAALMVSPAESQEPPITVLSQPDQACERGFTNLVGIKELRDGRVILVDEIEKLILLLDAELAEGKPIGREGAGPGEYVVPSRLFSLGGDSSAVLDEPNRRLLVLTPEGEPGGVVNFVGGVGTPSASDDRGRFYSSWQGAVRRWTPPASAVDTVAYYPVARNPRSVEGVGIVVPRGEDINPLPARPLWVVAPSGRVAVVHPDPYRVEMFGTDGSRGEGPVIPVEPIRVTEGHKEQWREEASRPHTVMTIVRGARAPTYSSQVSPPTEPTHWPEHLPPFLFRDVTMFAPDGRLWVQRTTAEDDPPTFDVFDSEGVRVEQVTLPPGRKLIGFGRGTVYTVVRDELDLEYLERYRLGGVGKGR